MPQEQYHRLIDTLIPNQEIGYGKFIGSVTVDSPNSGSTITDLEIRNLIQQEIKHNKVPAPTENTVYFIYSSPGITVIYGGGKSCQTFCAYHGNIGESIFYVVNAYPDCAGCQGGLSIADSLTVTSSHEMCDMITDKLSGTGWFHDEYGNIGDMCAWQTKKLGNFTIQKEWSNRTNSCI